MALDYVVIAAYVLGMVGVGWWGLRRATTRSDYLVAGRRLGWAMYSGTMSAVVLGGASTIGGIALGYQFGISGAWLVFTIGLGILALSAFFARRIVRLRVYTVPEMLDLRYGGSTSIVSGVVMWGYTLMLSVTSTIAYATVFEVLFGLPKAGGVVIGGVIVVLYSALGGMWSITMTDIVQFVVKTVGILLVLLPTALVAVGGFGGLHARLPAGFFDVGSIGTGRIVTYLLIYVFGLLIGQDIWQRVFTARTPRVATAGGLTSGLYCVVYAIAGALIGSAAKVLYPNLPNPDAAFATIVTGLLPAGLRGLVLAAALAAMMSTASGALIACSTVAQNDILRRGGVRANRIATLALGVVVILVAIIVDDVVAALTVAYNLLVGGLLVAIIGGLLWKRGTRVGAMASMIAGAATVIASMLAFGLLADEPIYYGLLASLVVYVAVSLATPRTAATVLHTWEQRLAGVSA
ncbi:MAG TPA: sodium:solute symporter [Kutzneria sp.]|jgi:SSS family solute:Na+ symporter